MPTVAGVAHKALLAATSATVAELLIVPTVLPATKIEKLTKYPEPETTNVGVVTVEDVWVP